MIFYLIRRLFFLCLLFIVYNNRLYSQNLVNNPSFEKNNMVYNILCNNDSLPICSNWYTPTNGTPDYYNEIICSNLINLYGNKNKFGFQIPLDGNAYWGLGVMVICPLPICNNYREYIQSKLLNSLIANKEYCVSFYVSLADSAQYATNGIGVLFSDSVINDSNGIAPLLPYNAQINYPVIIRDKLNWTHITGSFLANGGEQYITIGNFRDDSSTDTMCVGGAIHQGEPYSYYYVDAVCVYPCDTIVYTANAGGDKNICTVGESITLGTNNKQGYKYFWYDKNGNLYDTTGYISITPTEDCIFYLKVIDFTFTESWDTVHIKIGCEGITYIPNIFSPNGDSKNDKFYIRGENISQLDIKVYNRWGEMVFETQDINEGWDGRYKKKDCDEGVYFYVAEITFVDRTTSVKKGNVTLVR